MIFDTLFGFHWLVVRTDVDFGLNVVEIVVVSLTGLATGWEVGHTQTTLTDMVQNTSRCQVVCGDDTESGGSFTEWMTVV